MMIVRKELEQVDLVRQINKHKISEYIKSLKKFKKILFLQRQLNQSKNTQKIKVRALTFTFFCSIINLVKKSNKVI